MKEKLFICKYKIDDNCASETCIYSHPKKTWRFDVRNCQSFSKYPIRYEINKQELMGIIK